jgi:energy-coupling factor transporter ATP-binding protein EcfA2
MNAICTKPLRLASIQICSYRGFPHAVEIRLASAGGQGRSLLLYGENGSGKSSVGKAIRDFLDYRKSAVPFDEFKYRHTEPPNPERSITLKFDAEGEAQLVWIPSGRNSTHRHFRDMARASGWLDYRVVWRASDVQYGNYVDIFRPLVEEILPSCQRGVSNETFGQAWEKILELADKKPRVFGSEKIVLTQLLESLKQFNESLRGFLPELEKQANSFLNEFATWTSMELKLASDSSYNSSSHRNKFSTGSVQLRMRERGGEPLSKPSEFLNEARVTAIGLCLYLAGMARSIPPRRSDGSSYPRILVLDDVLLSLDMSHRLPLLRVLRDHFKEWQVLLLTHDRAWYEIAKQQLDGWAHHELFTVRVGDYEQPILREDQDHLYWAMEFLEKGHVKAAAVHVRTKFELVLKWACHSFGLAVKYQPEAHKVPARDFWSALQSATIEVAPPPGYHRSQDGQTKWWQPGADNQRVVPLSLVKRIDHAVSWVLNPLSHSQTVDRYRPEIDDAIYAVDELETAVKRAILLEKAGPVLLRQMLVTMINQQRVGVAASVAPTPTPVAKSV